MNFSELLDLKKELYGDFSLDALRPYRAISWGLQAEKSNEIDIQFIFYWISLNSLYDLKVSESNESERYKLNIFFQKIARLDIENKIPKTMLDIQNQLRIFVENNYVYDTFWEVVDELKDISEFNKEKERKKKTIYYGLLSDNCINFLDTLFSLIYQIRNQIFHGAATYGSSTNRDQVSLAVSILKELVPIFTEIVLRNVDEDWGEPSYAPINHK